MSDDARAEEVALACRILGKLDLTHGAFGHVSARLDGGDTMAIKAKGPEEVGLRFTEPADIIEVDFDGKKTAGPEGLWPPGESHIHISMYKRHPEIQSVVHVHPECAVLLTTCEKEIYPFFGSYAPSANRIAIEGVPVYPKSLSVVTNELGEEFAAYAGDAKAILMYGHGATTVGSSVIDASLRAISLNQLLELTYKAYLLGGAKRLPDSEIDKVRAGRDPNSKTGAAHGDDGLRAQWRYFRQLLGED